MKRHFKLIAIIFVILCSVAIPTTWARLADAARQLRPKTESLNAGKVSVSPSQTGGQKVSGKLMKKRPYDPALTGKFRNYDLIQLDPQAAAAQVKNTRKLLISTSKGDLDLELEPHDLRTADYVAQVITADGVAHKLPATPVTTYKGKVAGNDAAQARMNIKADTIEAAIVTGTERYYLQPARSLSKLAQSDEFVFYNGADVTNDVGTCGVTLAQETAEAVQRSQSTQKTSKAAAVDFGTSQLTAITPLKEIRLATDADAEYVTAMGGASQANQQIQDIINFVQGIYEVEIGLSFTIAFQNAWADAATDPYSATAATTLLDQLKDHWEANFTNVQRSLTHLWTGKNLDGSTIGISYTNTVCRDSSFSYGLSQRFPTTGTSITSQTIILTAHEIGHNFSATHPNEATEFTPPDIELGCENSIMDASIGDGSNFCPFSRSQIIGHATAFPSCLVNTSVPAPTSTCNETPIATNGSSVNGTLSTSDCRTPWRGVHHYADRYTFNANAGQQVRITQTSSAFDAYLYLVGPDGQLLVQDDDGGGGNDARIPAQANSFFTLPLTGKYIIDATTFDYDDTGNYTISALMSGCTLSASPTSQNG